MINKCLGASYMLFYFNCTSIQLIPNPHTHLPFPQDLSNVILTSPSQSYQQTYPKKFPPQNSACIPCLPILTLW